MEIRHASLLAALSVATDLGTGHPPEKAIRATLVAVDVGRAMGLEDRDLADVYYTTLLRHLGCSATAHEEAYLFGGDELASRRLGERADFASPREMLGLLLSTGRGTGAMRIRYLGRAIRASGKKADARIFGALCEVAASLAERLGMPEGVRTGVAQVFERWDGKGGPAGLGGDEISIGARLAEIGHQVAIFDALGGADAVLEIARRRAGGWFDPRAAEALAALAPELLTRLADGDPWDLLLDAEPEPRRVVGEAALDDLCGVFAHVADLKTPFTLGHSTGVAELAARAAASLGLGDEAVAAVRRAALLHDAGRIAVPNGVWEKPGPLTSTEWEQVRLHPYQTERILARVPPLAALGRLAGGHHERQDGSGYPAGRPGRELPVESRIIGAADAYQAMTQERPHRPAIPPAEAAGKIEEEMREGRLDADAGRAVLDAAGAARAKRGAWPAGLSDREIEVLRLVAAGRSNKEIAAELTISPRTAEHHVQHVYAKIGFSTRAGAAVFAMEHGIVR